MRLNKLCTEPIFKDFYFGYIYGEKQIIDKSTGYFNASYFCSNKGENIKEWLKTKRTKNIKTMFERGGLRNQLKFYEVKINKETSEKLDHKMVSILNGLYVHEGFLLDLYSWLSPSFYQHSSDIVLNTLTSTNNNYNHVWGDETVEETKREKYTPK